MLWFCSKCDLVDSRLIESSCARWLTSIHATKDSSHDETKVFSFPGSGGFRWSWSHGVLYWWVKREELPCGEEDQLPRPVCCENEIWHSLRKQYGIQLLVQGVRSIWGAGEWKLLQLHLWVELKFFSPAGEEVHKWKPTARKLWRLVQSQYFIRDLTIHRSRGTVRSRKIEVSHSSQVGKGC